MVENRQAVVLLSSGLDSSAALALAQSEGWKILQSITFDYGQRAAHREVTQSRAISDHFGVPHRSLVLPWFKGFGKGGGLLDSNTELPHPETYQLTDLDFTEQSARAVWVPNRNGVFLEIGAGIAEDMGAEAVIIGFNKEEAATFPDNTTDYLKALTHALSYSTANKVKVLSPTAELTKQEIVAKARAIDFPFSLLWSCYEHGETMCGRCESCMRLKQALHRNQVPVDEYFRHPNL